MTGIFAPAGGRVIVAGGRDFHPTQPACRMLDQAHALLNIREVVSGGARGADAFGEEWAAARGLPVLRFPADWEKWGLAAGFRRNQAMADYADALVAFPGGSGTEDMVRRAQRRRLRVLCVRAVWDLDTRAWDMRLEELA